MTVKLKTPSNGSVSLTPQDTAADVVLTVPATTGTVNTSGVVNEVPAGSASAPAIYPTGDTNTGIFFPAADTIAFSVGGAGAMRIDSSGSLLVGTATARRKLTIESAQAQIALRNSGAAAGKYWDIGPDGAGSALVVYNQNSTGVYIADGATSWTANSDERTKDIIEPIEDAANKVASLRAVIGKYKTDPEGTRRAFLIAQDVQAVLPEAVNQQNDEMGTLGLQYTDTIPLLVAAIKEQQAIINSLQDRITALENA